MIATIILTLMTVASLQGLCTVVFTHRRVKFAQATGFKYTEFTGVMEASMVALGKTLAVVYTVYGFKIFTLPILIGFFILTTRDILIQCDVFVEKESRRWLIISELVILVLFLTGIILSLFA